MAENRTTTVSVEILNDGGTPNGRVSEMSAEILSDGGGSTARVTDIAVEVLIDTTTAADHYFAAGIAQEVLSSGDGSDAQAAAIALEVASSGDGSIAQSATIAMEVLSTVALAPTRAFDGSKIYEFVFAFQPETIYNEADYDSIYSVGDRVGNGTVSWTHGGWSGTFGDVQDLTDHNWGLSGGNGFTVSGQDGWPGGAFAGMQILDGSYQHISGFKFYKEGGAAWAGFWIMYAGYDGGVWAVNHLEFDQFSIGFSGNQVILEFTPPITPFNYYSYTLASLPDGSDVDWPGNSFGNEVLFKVYHSVLDGGDRRSTNGRAIKRVTMTHSSGIVDNSSSDPPFDAMANPFDGRYAGSNGGPVPPFNKSETTQLRRVGWVFGDDAILAPGEWLQFSFPRKVFMREMVWNVGGSGETLDSGGDPTIYGTWQWYASNSPNSGFIAIGSPWHFNPGSNWMKSPRPRPDSEYAADTIYPYWRMVLVEGPAFGGGVPGNIYQIQFNLIDPDNQAPLYEIAFSDDTDGQRPNVVVGPAGSPYDVKLTDGDDDKLTATLSVVNNPILSVAFSDGTGDGMNEWGSFYPTIFSQTMVVVKGR